MSASTLVALMTAMFTALAVVVTVIVSRANQRRSHNEYLENLWSQILSFAQEHPDLCDLSRTTCYMAEMDWQQRLSYDAMCLNAWSIIYEASLHRMIRQGRLGLALEWVAAFHTEWLRNNAQLFPSDRFWRELAKVDAHESRLTRHRPVPSLTGITTWDALAPRYFQTVLSPFDPQVTVPNALTIALTDTLKTMARSSHQEKITLVDLGCGPGNLIEVLRDTDQADELCYVGIDVAPSALQLAQDRCKDVRFQCLFVESDIRSTPTICGNIVVSVNVVLGESRAANRELFEATRNYLKDKESVAIFVLPAYDVIEYIGKLRYQYYKTSAGADHAVRTQRAYEHWKRPNPGAASYSDDGWTAQCFHTLETIHAELTDAGFAIWNSPQKLRYPWALARQFDYGYFPEAEEIWDWVVVCTPAETTLPESASNQTGFLESGEPL